MVVQSVNKNNMNSVNFLKQSLEELKEVYDEPMQLVESTFKDLKVEIENTINSLVNNKKRDEFKSKLNEMITKLSHLESECVNNYFKIKPIKERIEEIENKIIQVTDKSDYLYDLIKKEKHDLKKLIFSNKTVIYLDKNKCENKFLFNEKNPFKLIIITNEYYNSILIDNLKNKKVNLIQKLTSEEIKMRLLEISIHMVKNHITEISTESIEKSKLYLNGTLLEKIEDNAFQKSKSLKEVNLSANKIDKIRINSFNGLENLEYLHLSENLLTSIETNSFRDLRNLRELNLNGCLLTSIRANLLQDLVNLQILNLSNNKISVIEINSFQKLSNLTYLFLSRNLLTDLPKKLFNGLTNLKMLNLSDNMLTSIDSNAFKGVTKLRTLFLCHNPLSNEFQYIFIRNKFKSNFKKTNPDCKVIIEDN